jgi:hypothetical protein
MSSLATVQAGTPEVTSPATDTDTRYGLFNGLDHRSVYGLGVFPEPFLVDDSDLEVNELRLDWFYARQADSARSNGFKAELEKGFGNLTVEIEIPFEIDKAPGMRAQNGFDNIDLGARYPLYQFVSQNKMFDTTFGVGIEVGVPVHSTFSKNTEIVPKAFNDTKIGNFTLQTLLGYSMLRGGGGEEAGINAFEFGFVAGYAIQKPFAGVEQLIPVFELSGEKQLNKDAAGTNTLIGDVGFRFNLSAIGHWQPRLGIVYAFPIHNAHEELHSGLYTSLVFDF